MKRLYTSFFNVKYLLCYSLILLGCDKEISEANFPQLQPATTDNTGGSWKPVLISSPQGFDIAHPTDVNSDEYSTELNELKNLSKKLSNEQQKAISYWSAGGVLRWNEIARELVSKYNLPPVNNEDGSYPIPDAANPTAYPKFPFANPPYAARAYALLSVAQYDALVVAWHHKYLYNRMAPSKNDNSISVLVPVTDLPSYPSEDAVIASVSFELLKFLFPGEVEYLAKLKEEHENSRLWAGANVRSDVAAGDALGKTIAAKVIEYGKEDGMKNAGKWNPDLASAAEANAMANLGGAWKSLETPGRSPMLPNYGAVKNWLFDDETKVKLRPPAPPRVGSAEFNQALKELKDLSKNITREQFRIVSFWADGVATPTPPGHWNAIAAGLIVKNQMNELRTARTFALLNMALQDAAVCCWETKFHYYLPRPSQVDPQIKTATGMPNFPAYTSGHATFSGAASTVLSYIFPEETAKLNAMAEEASISRMYGGIHYRFDSEVGLKCGKSIGTYAVEKGMSDGSN